MFVDSDPKTNCIDPAKIEAAITPKTKAIVPVHLYGQCADMKAIRKIADKHKLLVIEDNAQAIGARGDGFKIGELSDAVCTSFIIQKNLGTFGDGGAVVTNRRDIDRTVRRLRNHGSEKRSCHSYGLQQPPRRHPRRRAERQAEAHRRSGTTCAASGPRAIPSAWPGTAPSFHAAVPRCPATATSTTST